MATPKKTPFRLPARASAPAPEKRARVPGAARQGKPESVASDTRTPGKSRHFRTPNPPDARNAPDRLPPGERLHKMLAQAGLGSRREMEALIAAGKIEVNGKAAQIGQSVGKYDRVKVNGKLVTLHFSERLPRVILYHKPEGEIVSRDDPEGRPNIFSAMPRLRGGRWVAVGRLDLNTSGLILLTTSGTLANQLMHPGSELLREYAVRVLGEISFETRKQLLDGIELEDGPARFISFEESGGTGANRWYKVSLYEGRNREVRRMFEAVGHKVSRLIRVRYGPFMLPSWLKRGQYRELEERDVQSLMNALDNAGGKTPEPTGPRARGDNPAKGFAKAPAKISQKNIAEKKQKQNIRSSTKPGV